MRFTVFVVFITLGLISCDPADISRTLGTVLDTEGELTTTEVAGGLKQALNQGVSEGVDRLSQKNGYYKSVYKILLPEQARQITDKLSGIPGFRDVEEVIIEKINRAAEDAAQKAGPIFVDAIREMTFQDAMGILMGADTAATSYLDRKTSEKLYQEFQPVILESLNKFNAVDYWEEAVNTYNSIPFVEKMNPRLDDYVTHRALDGLFDMVEKEERAIRHNISKRTTDLMRRVFAKQD